MCSAPLNLTVKDKNPMNTLTEKLTPDVELNKNFYQTPERMQRLHLIRHLLQNSEQLLFVIAPFGAGKTTLLEELQQMPFEHFWIYTLKSSPALSPIHSLTLLLNQFNVRQTGKSIETLQEHLRSHIAAKRYNGEIPILFVDDAHLLPLATLKLMIECAMQGEAIKRLRVVLFCEPQMSSILATPEFSIVQHTLTHTLDLPLLTKAQAKEYVEFCLARQEQIITPLMSHEWIRHVYLETEGNPAKINTFIEALIKKQRPSPILLNNPSGIPNRWLWGMISLLLIVGIMVTIRWKYADIFIDKTAENITERVIILPLTEHTPLAHLSAGNETGLPDLHLPLIPNLRADLAPPSALPPAPPLMVSQDILQPPPQILAPSPLPRGRIDPQILLGIEAVYGEDWLLSQHPDTYTIQVLGAHDPSTLKTFLRHHSLKNIALFKTEYRQRDWYVLLYGVYPDQSQAMLALQSLDMDLRQATRPWPRSMANIQAQIKRRLGE
jgi:DamX protein